ncbi:CGNR zinc finger domain-containing protein [Actinomadura luteofluorescens]|uniref:CGNR zinc finger domain-containing protein n=1 Tax=Actinomadura luteofluorescens TaxID=46163 RepID=UPI0034817690
MARRPLTGEPLPLDLVNTRWPASGVMHDELDDPVGLAGWLHEHGLEVDEPEHCAEPLRAARAAIRLSLEEGVDDQVNAVLAHGGLRLFLKDGTPSERPELDSEAWRPAWLATRAYLDLLGTAPPGRLRHCEGTGCVLWFLDTSRSGRRRWCSMAGCGNRAKAKAHYQRTPRN